jgi:hypothetical protein
VSEFYGPKCTVQENTVSAWSYNTGWLQIIFASYKTYSKENKLHTSLFLNVTQRILVVVYQSFGTAYRPQLQSKAGKEEETT